MIKRTIGIAIGLLLAEASGMELDNHQLFEAALETLLNIDAGDIRKFVPQKYQQYSMISQEQNYQPYNSSSSQPTYPQQPVPVKIFNVFAPDKDMPSASQPKTVMEKLAIMLYTKARKKVPDMGTFLYTLVFNEGNRSRIITNERIIAYLGDNMPKAIGATGFMYPSMAFLYNGTAGNFFKLIYKIMHYDGILWDSEKGILSCPLRFDGNNYASLRICARSRFGEIFQFYAKEIRFIFYNNGIGMFPSAWDPGTGDWIIKGEKLIIKDGYVIERKLFNMDTLETFQNKYYEDGMTNATEDDKEKDFFNYRPKP
ncbi:MAG: hypothetical protein LBT67_01605 [Holosporaceae bacterium]|jgi:hypothetical protein|nr:hypothetical protein [Holosporaceae bacterium]